MENRVGVDGMKHEDAEETNPEPEGRSCGARTPPALHLREEVIENPALKGKGREAEEAKNRHFKYLPIPEKGHRIDPTGRSPEVPEFPQDAAE